MTPNQLIAAEVLAETSHDLTIVFTDGTDEVFPAVLGSTVDNGVLRLHCRDAGKHSVYSLPLANIRMWHRELT